MSSILRKPFHGQKRTAADAPAQESRAPTCHCDLCYADISASGVDRLPAAMFKEIAQSGYDPYARGRAPTLARQLYDAVGKTSQDAYKDWREMVERDNSDWALCDTCTDDVARFLLVLTDVR